MKAVRTMMECKHGETPTLWSSMLCRMQVTEDEGFEGV